MLEFCPVCKSLLKIKKEGEKTIGYCICGFKRSSGIELIGKDETIEKNKKQITEAGVGFETREGYENICKKCGYNKAEVLDPGGERTANESSVYFFKCLKCGSVIRMANGR